MFAHVDPRLHRGEVGESAVHGVKREAVYACEHGVHIGMKCVYSCVYLHPMQGWGWVMGWAHFFAGLG